MRKVEGVTPDQLMCVSAAASRQKEVEQTMQLIISIQGHPMKFLVDSGSTHSFLNTRFLDRISHATHIKLS
jgi:hypothetical protein